MFASANAAVVPGKVTDTMPGLDATVATRKLGTKSLSCSAVAMTSLCCEKFPNAPNERLPASAKSPPSETRRPPHRRRARRRCCDGLAISRSTAGRPCCMSWITLFQSGWLRSFIGKVLEYAIGRDAVVALAQHGEEIRDDEQGDWGRKQEPADHRARQRGVLLLTGGADRHRDHAHDHGRRRHQHRPDPCTASIDRGPESAPPFELLLARKGDQEDGVR